MRRSTLDAKLVNRLMESAGPTTMIDEIGVNDIEENKQTQESVSTIEMVKEDEEDSDNGFDNAFVDIAQAYSTNRDIQKNRIMKSSIRLG